MTKEKLFLTSNFLLPSRLLTNINQYADRSQNRQHGRAAVAYQGQRHAGHGHDIYHAADIYESLQDNPTDYAHG